MTTLEQRIENAREVGRAGYAAGVLTGAAAVAEIGRQQQEARLKWQASMMLVGGAVWFFYAGGALGKVGGAGLALAGLMRLGAMKSDSGSGSDGSGMGYYGPAYNHQLYAAGQRVGPYVGYSFAPQGPTASLRY